MQFLFRVRNKLVKYLIVRHMEVSTYLILIVFFLSDQCLELCEDGSGETCGVRGQVIVSLLSRDGTRGEPASAAGEGSPLAVVGPAGDVRSPRDPPINTNTSQLPLPPHWEERFTATGRYASNKLLIWVFGKNKLNF